MRGDTRSNQDEHLQQDSSSGSSSPHSNPSRDDEILEVSPPDFMPKPIYNFSIPDVIKHEPRVERHDNNERLDCSMPNSSLRKRTHPSRHIQEQLLQENDIPVSVSRKKRRRLAGLAGAENLIDDDDDDCHRPDVIDLTDIDSHVEYTNAHSDSEVNDSSHIETRPLHHTTPGPSYNEVLTNLQRFRQQLEESHERVHILRSSRLHRLRRRRNSRAIITDGPMVTDDMLVQPSPEPDIISTPEMTSLDDSVMVINEVRGEPGLYIGDHDIALRMANDPTYSPPYHNATNPSNEHFHSRYTRTDESFHNFQERIRCIRQRSRDRLDQVRRMSQQAQERLARIHESINSLRHGRRPLESIPDPTETNNENSERFEEAADENTEVNDDVEIIRESIPQNTTLDYLEPISSGLSPASFSSMRSSGHSNSRQHMPLPDFLRPLMNSFLTPIPPPRLHHLHDVPEGYEVLWNLAERLGPAKPRGLNKQEIDQIPSFRFSASTSRETNTKCVVCMGEYNNREKLRRLSCTHDFHSKCIDKWLRSNKTCPVCRDEVKVETNKPYTP